MRDYNSMFDQTDTDEYFDGETLIAEDNSEAIFTSEESIDVIEDRFEEKLGRVANCQKVYLREQPLMDDDVEKKIIDKGTELFVTGEEGDWYKAALANGYEGYVKKEFVAIEE